MKEPEENGKVKSYNVNDLSKVEFTKNDADTDKSR